MKLLFRMSFFTIVSAIFAVSMSFAQGARPSQRGFVEQTVGTTQIRVTYHRPNAKGRVLWGDEKEGAVPDDNKVLVPNGKVWRSGANEATVFEVTSDVTINGKVLPAGKYGFYTIPTAGEWTLIFNKTWDQWGTRYSDEADALRVMTKPMISDESKESLAYMIEDVDADSAVVVLAWGKARIPFTVSTANSTVK